jgi:hypothetical protein
MENNYKMKHSNKVEQNLKPEITDKGISLVHTSKPGWGWQNLQFYLETENKESLVLDQPVMEQKEEQLILSYSPSSDLTVTLTIQNSPSDNGISIIPKLKNNGKSSLKFKAYGFQPASDCDGMKLEAKNRLPVFANSENLRLELPHCRNDFPFIRPFPPELSAIGTAPCGPIPALFVGLTDCDTWLAEGCLTQKRHIISWVMGMSPSKPGRSFCKSRYLWSGTEYETVNPNEEIELETTLYKIIKSSPDQLYSQYFEELNKLYHFAGEDSLLKYEPVFCTWNYNIFTNINEEDCLKRIELAGELQNHKGFFQVDHGYQPQLSGEPAEYTPFNSKDLSQNTPATPEVDAYYPDCSNTWDKNRFPGGPAVIVEACRKQKLKPSIWWSPRVSLEGRIQQAHPEWLLCDQNGAPLDVGSHYCIDPSVKEGWDFLEECVRVITKEWGFQGMKLDFFSWTFDHPKAVFKNGGTNIYWKYKFIKMIRSYLGPEGYFMHCISCPLGNPFLAINGFDAFRAGIDIHSGEWSYHVKSANWLLPAVLATGKNTWFANIDSCMGKAEIPTVERRSRLNFAYMTAGMLELSGPIENLDQEALDDYKKLCLRCDAGSGVKCPDQEALFGRPLPKILVREHSQDSLTFKEFKIKRSIGFFNWTDQVQHQSFDISELVDSENFEINEFWNQQGLYRLEDKLITVTLPPRASCLIDIS